MKKFLLILAVVAMLLPGCKKIEESIDALENRIDKLEQETIPTIDEQIAAINLSLDALEKADEELGKYIQDLEAVAANLQEQINDTNIKIDEVKVALQNEISTAKADVLAQLDAVKAELEAELATINATIETLKAKDAELDKKIANLRSYVDTELGKTTDWVNATFATLEQYNALVSEVATIKEQIKAINQSITDLETRLTTKINEDIAKAVSTLNADIQQKVKDITDAYTNAVKTAKEEITSAYTTAIQTAITTLDNSLKSWVGEQLSNYYTIAEVNAKISALQTAINEGDAKLQEELKSLKSQLETTATEITAAYKKAIEEAINTNNGVIDTKIANEIASVNQRITNEVATINAKIAEIESRLDNVEAKIAELLARIQSVSYIPTYDDGKATLKWIDNISQVTLDFEISPKDAVAELAKVWQSAVSVKAIYTQTRAVEFIDMPITKFETDATNGVITLTASGENLLAELFAGTQSASVRLSISDGCTSVVSDYIPMVAKEITNEIWYTSTDGQIVVPSSLEGFGANVILNTYQDGKGVIKFDDAITSIGNDAFYNCKNLYTITYPNSITIIGKRAFRNCTYLYKIHIHKNVNTIGENAFYGCERLGHVYSDNIASWCSINFENQQANPLHVYGYNFYEQTNKITNLIIPNNVSSIGKYTFYGCKGLKDVIIPDSVTKIENMAFAYCIGLTNITIPDSVLEIEPWTFANCENLQSVNISKNIMILESSIFRNCYNLRDINIPNGVHTIGNAAFYSCKSLERITIPDSVTAIKDYAFSYCENLMSIYCKPVNPPTGGSSMFNGIVPGRKIYVPQASVNAYKTANGWSDYADYIVGYEFE